MKLEMHYTKKKILMTSMTLEGQLIKEILNFDMQILNFLSSQRYFF